MQLVRSLIVGSLFAFAYVFPVSAAQVEHPVDTVLANGMRVVVVPDRIGPVVTTILTYGAGSNEETLPGQAHAVEHMLFRGTATITASELADLCARMGARYNASTGNDRTQYWFAVPSAYLGVVLRIEADRMRNATISPQSWGSERGAIEQEVRSDESAPAFAIQGRIREALFTGTPYVRDALGTVGSFDTMQASDLRAFYDAWYHPNNATLVVAGDVDPKQTLARIRSAFESIPSAPLPSRKPIALAPLAASSIDATADVPLGQAGLAFRLPGPKSPDFPALVVLQGALGAADGPFVETNVAGTTLGAGLQITTIGDSATGFISSSVKGGGTPAAMLGLLQSTLAKTVADGVTKRQVDDAKRAILSNDAYALTSIPGAAFGWSSALALGFSRPDALSGRFARVGVSDVDRVLRTYFGTAQHLSVVVGRGAAAPGASHDAGGEHVAYIGGKPEALRGWARAAFRTALAPPAFPASVRSFTLPNGIRLTVAPIRGIPVVVLTGSIKNNQTLYAPRGLQGVAEMTDALMSFGSMRLDRKAFANAVAALPASIGAGTSFVVRSARAQFDRSLALLADEMLHPRFPADGFALLQSNYAQTLATTQNRPPWKSELALDRALYSSGDPAARHATEASVRALTLEDVRAWYVRAFRPDETSISIVGAIDPNDARREIAKYFGGWTASGSAPAFGYPAAMLNGPSNADVPSPTAAQTSVRLVELLPIHRNNPDRFALMLADTMLTGEGASSILTDDLRTRNGYVYDVGSTLDIGRQRSTYTFSFGAAPKDVASAEAALRAELRALQTQPVSNDMLARAKAVWLARSTLALDSYFGLALAIRPASDAGDSRENWKALLAVTPAQVRDAMAKWVRVDRLARIAIVPIR